MRKEIHELRPLPALALLTIWRESGAAAETELERSLLCNASVLAESCFSEGERVFPDGASVLAELTPREMEELLVRLAGERTEETDNPAFDRSRFEALREG